MSQKQVRIYAIRHAQFKSVSLAFFSPLCSPVFRSMDSTWLWIPTSLSHHSNSPRLVLASPSPKTTKDCLQSNMNSTHPFRYMYRSYVSIRQVQLPSTSPMKMMWMCNNTVFVNACSSQHRRFSILLLCRCEWILVFSVLDSFE
jgi:hypothetical protein